MNAEGFRLRPMTEDDVAAANALALEQGWRDRTDLYRFALRVRSCHPLVGVASDRLVATGLATANGRVGWLGAIVVDREFRRRGFGRAVTEALIARLWAAGCETISLEATDIGRPMYEQMGFRTLCHYLELDADPAPVEPVPPRGTRVRSLEQADLPGVLALDRAATGEDRREALGVLAESGGWILEGPQSDRVDPGSGRTDPGPLALRGFCLLSDRGNAAIIAQRAGDGLFLLDLHRHLAPEGHHARCGIPDVQAPALTHLAAHGWRVAWRIPRLILGRKPDWRPTWIWGQINSAIG